MSETFSSPNWYRVAQGRPRLRMDLAVRHHVYLGREWFVLSDPTSNKVHRLSEAAYRVVAALDGRRSIGAIWQDAVDSRGVLAPSQDEVLQVLSQLHSADLLDGEAPPLIEEAKERQDRERRQKLMKTLFNPLSATVPLVNPHRFLGHLARLTSVLPRALWWLAVPALVIPALFLAVLHRDGLAVRGLDALLDGENLLAMALIYPVVKALHEIAHGVAIRSRGGEVQEMGLMFIAFFPIPYVEASASARFPSKWDRAAVAGAGIAVEVVIAALALFLWLAVEPGLIRSLAWNTMVISGLSTVMVNGNPLLRFDGYHIFADLIEMPNLANRANAWWGRILRLHVLRTGERDLSPVRRREAWIFALYAPAAYVYRIWIMITISLFVATRYLLIGLLLGVWSMILGVIWPALKLAHRTWGDPRIRAAGARPVRRGMVAAGAVLVLVAVVPLPMNTVAQGVVWLPDDAILRAQVSGRVREVARRDGATLQPGDRILALTSPETRAALARAEAKLARTRVELAGVRFTDRAAALRLSQGLSAIEAEVATRRDQVAGLTVVAAVAGRLDLPGAGDLPGQYLREGDVLGFVLPEGSKVIRVVIRQQDIALVRGATRAVSLRLATDPATVHPATILREVPGGDRALPSAALALEGGGPFATVPDSGQQRADAAPQAVARLFQIDVAPLEPLSAPFGLRTFVRFDHPPRPLLWQVGRRLRDAFLGLLTV